LFDWGASKRVVQQLTRDLDTKSSSVKLGSNVD
jgi:hypothetical protein